MKSLKFAYSALKYTPPSSDAMFVFEVSHQLQKSYCLSSFAMNRRL